MKWYYSRYESGQLKEAFGEDSHAYSSMLFSSGKFPGIEWMVENMEAISPHLPFELKDSVVANFVLDDNELLFFGVQNIVMGQGTEFAIELDQIDWNGLSASIKDFFFSWFGYVGYVGFEYGRILVGYDHAPRNFPLPDVMLFLPIHGVLIRKSEVVLFGLIMDDAPSFPAVEIGEVPIHDGTVPLPSLSYEQYLGALTKLKQYIADGDIYQANFTQRFVLPFRENLYQILRKQLVSNPVPHWAYLHHPKFQIASFSPELFMKISDGHVCTKPIKGTRPRGQTKEEDEQLKQELLQSEKDHAELAMIVDLLRNDLGRSAKPGSVKVSYHAQLETYENVHHLVSKVCAEIPSGWNHAWRTFLRAFPGGSISGVPKHRALEIIESLEPVARGPYTGSFVLIASRLLYANICIRTVSLIGESAIFNAGGGIVHDSDPLQEYLECLYKAGHLTRYLGASFMGMIFWLNGRFCTKGIDLEPSDVFSQTGAFETIKIENGIPLNLEVHLERIKQGMDYWKLNRTLPTEAELMQLIKMNLAKDGKLNIYATGSFVYATISSYTPPDRIELLLENAEFDFVPMGFKPLPYVPYRERLNRALARSLWDTILVRNNYILEGSRSNIYVKHGGKWLTPATSCVPGTVRKHLLDAGKVFPAEITIQMLIDADDVAVSNSLIGFRLVQRVWKEDGVVWDKISQLENKF